MLGAYLVLYALYFQLLRYTHPPPWTAWAATTLEVSAATAATLLAARLDPLLALKDVPVLVYALAIFVSVGRLQRTLPLYAGLLAGAQWISIYIVTASMYDLQDPTLAPTVAWQRFTLLSMSGVLAEGLVFLMVGLIRDRSTIEQERDRLRRAFGAYVSEPVVQRVLRGDETTRVRTERREATVLFVDIRDFTQLTTHQPADEVLKRLNLTLERFGRHIHRKRGIVNKFLGDGLMAVFGAPTADALHAKHGFEAARALLMEADRLRLSGEFPELQVGIGLASGEVLAGDIGGAAQREYTVVGEVVNLAARLEQHTKDLGVPLLLDARVAKAVGPQAPLRKLDPLRIRGVPGEVAVWTINTPEHEALSEVEASGLWSGQWTGTLDLTEPAAEAEAQRKVADPGALGRGR